VSGVSGVSGVCQGVSGGGLRAHMVATVVARKFEASLCLYCGLTWSQWGHGHT
jgi:hypothetical protein